MDIAGGVPTAQPLIPQELHHHRPVTAVARCTRCGIADTPVWRGAKSLEVPILKYSSSVTTTLYRPVGQKELELIRSTGFRAFPPRLPEQPFFYPVLNEEYATQIARDWNTKDERSGFVGYVLRFEVNNDFLGRYEIHVAGNSTHREYWIPANDVAEFNRNIVGTIEKVVEFRPAK